MIIVSAFYLLGLWAYSLCLRFVSLFHAKARLLCRGRSDTWEKLNSFDSGGGTIWIHAASLGEFEQGRPLIEAIKEKNPSQKVVLTFYSPSGFEVRKNYDRADLVCYLPADGPGNARRFVDAINPTKVYFIKYEFWYFFLSAVRKRRIPLYGVSMIFRRPQPFFSTWGHWFRQMLKMFTHIYVQDEESAKLLMGIAIHNYSVVGDTRFDRVRQIADAAADIDAVAAFAKETADVIVAGSTWPPDEDILFKYINMESVGARLIVAPHEIDKNRVDSLCAKLRVPYVRFSSLNSSDIAAAKVFVVDTIGILSSIYRYGNVTYVGGGFGVGIHNTLEPAIYGRPVIFGPNYNKFKEALDLIACGGGFSISSFPDFCSVMERLYGGNRSQLSNSSDASKQYCDSMLGATKIIVSDTL